MAEARRVLTLEEARACMAADREAAERGEPGLGANGLFCRRCGGDLVEVDNPLRREFRHRRGQECLPGTRPPRVVTPSRTDRQPPTSAAGANSSYSPDPGTTKHPDLVTHHEET